MFRIGDRVELNCETYKNWKGEVVERSGEVFMVKNDLNGKRVVVHDLSALTLVEGVEVKLSKNIKRLDLRVDTLSKSLEDTLKILQQCEFRD